MAFVQKTAPPSKDKMPDKGSQSAAEKSRQTPTPALAARIVSLDQFRGYTVAGMFLVNYLGGYREWVPAVLLHHHNYCSYADTIMPQFLFAVGFAFRLTFGRRGASQGMGPAYFHMVKRLLGLLLVAFTIYTFGRVAGSWEELKEIGAWGAVKEPLKRQWMATLGQIAVTSLWLLPVIRAGAFVRIVYMLLSAGLHIGLSHWFNYIWTNSPPNGVDGGPLGFLTWAVPAIIGTLACDAIAGSSGRAGGWTLTKMTCWSVLLMAAGYAMSCGTRIYDLSPAELAQIKADRKTQDAKKKELGEELEALGKEYKAGSERLKKAQEKVDALRRKEVRAVVDELKSADANPLFFGFLVDKAEKEYNKRPTTDEMKAALANLESVTKEADLPRLQKKMKALPAAKEDELKKETAAQGGAQGPELSFRDVKLAADPVIPKPERFTAWRERVQQDWKKYGLTGPPFVMPPQDDRRIDAAPLDDHFHWNYWMITQRGGSLSYTTFCAGFSLLVYVLFYVVCDIGGWQLGLFRTFGTNALAGYVLHDMISGAVKQFVPGGAPWWYGLTSFFVFFGLVYLFVRTLEKNRIYLKL